MKKSWLIYGLALVWFFCFYSWKKNYWAEPETQVAIDLVIVEDDIHSKVDVRWRFHMSYLNGKGRDSSVKMGLQPVRETAAFEERSQGSSKERLSISTAVKHRDQSNDRPANPSLSLYGVTYQLPN